MNEPLKSTVHDGLEIEVCTWELPGAHLYFNSVVISGLEWLIHVTPGAHLDFRSIVNGGLKSIVNGGLRWRVHVLSLYELHTQALNLSVLPVANLTPKP